MKGKSAQLRLRALLLAALAGLLALLLRLGVGPPAPALGLGARLLGALPGLLGPLRLCLRANRTREE